MDLCVQSCRWFGPEISLAAIWVNIDNRTLLFLASSWKRCAGPIYYTGASSDLAQG